ncbi:hypothetical protein [Aquimarina brevivitae]|uniref:Uncharacterized protein n=1 Tax=Aquimarina brevivitae TaxID=323412 RepID=A0A4Q7P1E7_9FLAO|nr:hypothetical protein [Aquimarina brevivitae]RZS93666.1 hypothetical protein EV197_2246 [Aquimarina brevivitae]
MQTSKIIGLLLLITPSLLWAQETESDKTENISQETITKIIRIKGPNGEEKVIKQEQKITKKSSIQLNPDDSTQTNQDAMYTDAIVEVSSGSLSNAQEFSMVPDGNGYLIVYIEDGIKKIGKARPLNEKYYIVHFEEKDNKLGHFDTENHFVIQEYDAEKDEIATKRFEVN